MNISGRDEVGDLATAFNEMGERLIQARESIEAQNHSLEATVAERTRAIQERETHLQRQNEALRDNEERMRTILDSVQAGIVVVDSETRAILDINPVALALAGRRREEVIGHECHSLPVLLSGAAARSAISDARLTIRSGSYCGQMVRCYPY